MGRDRELIREFMVRKVYRECFHSTVWRCLYW